MDADKARQIVEAKNAAERQLEINLQIAKACLAAAGQNFINRIWRTVMTEFVQTKSGKNRTRLERAVMDMAFDSIRLIYQLALTRLEVCLEIL